MYVEAKPAHMHQRNTDDVVLLIASTARVEQQRRKLGADGSIVRNSDAVHKFAPKDELKIGIVSHR